jgi:hypothetical protein
VVSVYNRHGICCEAAAEFFTSKVAWKNVILLRVNMRFHEQIVETSKVAEQWLFPFLAIQVRKSADTKWSSEILRNSETSAISHNLEKLRQHCASVKS